MLELRFIGTAATEQGTTYGYTVGSALAGRRGVGVISGGAKVQELLDTVCPSAVLRVVSPRLWCRLIERRLAMPTLSVEVQRRGRVGVGQEREEVAHGKRAALG